MAKLTPEGIKAIDNFLARWGRGDRNFSGSHEASERVFVSVLRKLGVDIIKPPRGGFRVSPADLEAFHAWKASQEQQAAE